MQATVSTNAIYKDAAEGQISFWLPCSVGFDKDDLVKMLKNAGMEPGALVLEHDLAYRLEQWSTRHGHWFTEGLNAALRLFLEDNEPPTFEEDEED